MILNSHDWINGIFFFLLCSIHIFLMITRTIPGEKNAFRMFRMTWHSQSMWLMVVLLTQVIWYGEGQSESGNLMAISTNGLTSLLGNNFMGEFTWICGIHGFNAYTKWKFLRCLCEKSGLAKLSERKCSLKGCFSISMLKCRRKKKLVIDYLIALQLHEPSLKILFVSPSAQTISLLYTWLRLLPPSRHACQQFTFA